MIDILKEPLPPPFGSIRGAVVVVNKLVFPKGVLLPTEIDGFAMLAGSDLTALFQTAKDLGRDFLKLDFSLDGKLHPVPLSGLPITLPYEIAMGGSKTTLAVTVGKTGRADAQKALSSPVAPSPFFFFEGDYAALAQLNLDHGGGDDESGYKPVEGEGDGLGGVAGGETNGGTSGDDDEAEKIRSRIAIELYTRAMSTVDVDDRSVRLFMRYDRRLPTK
jgi:hypothetical protein